MEVINISGQHIDVGQYLQEYVKGRLSETISKYFDHASSASVNFTKSGFEFVCDVLVNDGTGRHTVIKSSANSDDIYSAFDVALSKISKQLRKYKSKLKNRSDRVKLNEVAPEAVKYVINPNAPMSSDSEGEVDVDNPMIIAEKPTQILKLSVGEAVMHMDLQNLPALLFENSKTGRVNVVYYRRDGNIAWVDSK